MSESKYFIEIGTADFDTFEYLAEKGWEGIGQKCYFKERFDDKVIEELLSLSIKGAEQFGG